MGKIDPVAILVLIKSLYPKGNMSLQKTVIKWLDSYVHTEKNVGPF